MISSIPYRVFSEWDLDHMFYAIKRSCQAWKDLFTTNRPIRLELQVACNTYLQPTGRFPLGNGTSSQVLFWFRASISFFHGLFPFRMRQRLNQVGPWSRSLSWKLNKPCKLAIPSLAFTSLLAVTKITLFRRSCCKGFPWKGFINS